MACMVMVGYAWIEVLIIIIIIIIIVINNNLNYNAPVADIAVQRHMTS